MSEKLRGGRSWANMIRAGATAPQIAKTVSPFFQSFRMPVTTLPAKKGRGSVALYDSALSRSAYGRRGSMPYRPTPIRTRRTHGIPTTLYDTALTASAFGRPQLLGDLFNDIMGTVVPGWDNRPEWMKQISLKADPAKILSAAQKIAPGAAGDAVRAANRAGFNVYVKTPGGDMLMTPDMAQGIYANYPMFTKARSMLGDLFGSPMVILAVGGIAVGLFLMMKK